MMANLTHVQYRVWVNIGNAWMPVSRPFDTERDAEIWALRLNFDHRVDPEDTD